MLSAARSQTSAEELAWREEGGETRLDISFPSPGLNGLQDLPVTPSGHRFQNKFPSHKARHRRHPPAPHGAGGGRRNTGPRVVTPAGPPQLTARCQPGCPRPGLFFLFLLLLRAPPQEATSARAAPQRSAAQRPRPASEVTPARRL